LKRKGIIQERILKPNKNDEGYFRVSLCKDGKQQSCKIARLVGMAFLEPPADGCDEIDHINRDKSDNRVENLRWSNRFTQSQNRDYVLNAKYICIFYSNRPRLISHWAIQWRYDGAKQKTKHFMTKDLAIAFSETLDKTNLKPLTKSGSKIIPL
jgi:hypothetical protein